MSYNDNPTKLATIQGDGVPSKNKKFGNHTFAGGDSAGQLKMFVEVNPRPIVKRGAPSII